MTFLTLYLHGRMSYANSAKRQKEEAALEKKLGFPAIGLTLLTFLLSFITFILPSDYEAEVATAEWLTGIAIIAVIINSIAYVYIKLGLLKGIFIISGIICTLIAANAWFIAAISL